MEANRHEGIRRLGGYHVYVISVGDSLSLVAASYGLNWRDLYNHPANAAFRQRRPNPHLIKPGDRIVIPPPP